MIKFFRNIRQSLLLENKTSKYLKYAIGEIVLVVIGILIALQVNNWNEDKKTQRNRYELVRLLITDLEEKEQEIQGDSLTFNKDLELYKTFRENWAKNQLVDSTNLEDVLNSFDQEAWFFNTNSATFANFSNSELWKSLPDSLTRQVSNLYYSDFGYMENYTARLVDYVANFKINFLVPNRLLDEELTFLEKKDILVLKSNDFFSYISLFEQYLIRMKRQWGGTHRHVNQIIINIEHYIQNKEHN